jgi:hypothetical protein
VYHDVRNALVREDRNTHSDSEVVEEYAVRANFFKGLNDTDKRMLRLSLLGCCRRFVVSLDGDVVKSVKTSQNSQDAEHLLYTDCN